MSVNRARGGCLADLVCFLRIFILRQPQPWHRQTAHPYPLNPRYGHTKGQQNEQSAQHGRASGVCENGLLLLSRAMPSQLRSNHAATPCHPQCLATSGRHIAGVGQVRGQGLLHATCRIVLLAGRMVVEKPTVPQVCFLFPGFVSHN